MDSLNPASQPSSSGGLKEWVAALLSVSIVACMIVFLYGMYIHADPNDPDWAHRSSLLQIIVGFAGTATGYYFGRIPAEQAAASAHQAAAAAQANVASSTALAQQASDSEQRMRAQVSELRDHITGPLGGAAADSPDATRAEMVYRLNRILGS